MADTIDVYQVLTEAGFNPEGRIKAYQTLVEAGYSITAKITSHQVVVEVGYRPASDEGSPRMGAVHMGLGVDHL